MKNRTSIGDRMKENYESRYRVKLTRRTPVILRLDGKAFHTLCKCMQKPFDETFIKGMVYAAGNVCEEIQGAKCAYIQSDEVSILLTDFDQLNTSAWFDYNLQKLVSVAAAMMSVNFSRWLSQMFEINYAVFDCRAFNIPKEEVCNYFIWRQKDWIRNSVHMLARSVFSQKELQNKKVSDMLNMLQERGIDWHELDAVYKNGTFIYKELNINDVSYFAVDYEADFTTEKYRGIVEKYLYINGRSSDEAD